MSPIRGANTRSRLLCPVCHEIKQVTAIESELLSLACGHTRPELLPLGENRVSLENLRTAIGQRMFPAIHKDELTSSSEWQDLWRT
jgi:hypothetical protein